MRGVSGFRTEAEHCYATCVDYHLGCSRLLLPTAIEHKTRVEVPFQKTQPIMFVLWAPPRGQSVTGLTARVHGHCLLRFCSINRATRTPVEVTIIIYSLQEP